MDKNPPEKKSCGMCWFWANLKGETKSDNPTQSKSWGKTVFVQITQKVKEIKKKSLK